MKKAPNGNLKILPILITLATLLTGCSMDTASDNQGNKYTPETQNTETSINQATDLSSKLYDMLRTKGKATQAGPGVTDCKGLDAQKFYKIHHPWSLFGVPAKHLKKTWENLKEDLERSEQWNVVDQGRQNSKAYVPYLAIDSRKYKFTAKITMEGVAEDGNANGQGEPLMYFDLVSACFQVPAGKTVDDDNS